MHLRQNRGSALLMVIVIGAVSLFLLQTGLNYIQTQRNAQKRVAIGAAMEMVRDQVASRISADKDWNVTVAANGTGYGTIAGCQGTDGFGTNCPAGWTQFELYSENGTRFVTNINSALDNGLDLQGNTCVGFTNNALTKIGDCVLHFQMFFKKHTPCDSDSCHVDVLAFLYVKKTFAQQWNLPFAEVIPPTPAPSTPNPLPLSGAALTYQSVNTYSITTAIAQGQNYKDGRSTCIGAGGTWSGGACVLRYNCAQGSVVQGFLPNGAPNCVQLNYSNTNCTSGVKGLAANGTPICN
jgi:hypothetical protein